jgi:LysR family hydrogen peroxide-inducible transcriptional activator
MKLQGVTLRDISYVVAVAEHGHFGRAADASHVSQPSLSVGVRKVEEALGYPIFERASRKVLVTPLGAAVIDRARAVLNAADAMLIPPDESGDPLSGRFSLGAIATVGPYVLPGLLRPLREAHPNLELDIEEGLTERLVARLQDGALDAVILSPPISESGLTVAHIYREPFRLIVPANSKLAEMDRISVADLDPADAVLLEEGHCLRDQALDICGSGSARHRHTAMSLETLKAMVAAGSGYSLIPASAVREPENYDHLVGYRTLQELGVGRDVALVWRESRPRTDDVAALVRLLRAHPPRGAVVERAVDAEGSHDTAGF